MGDSFDYPWDPESESIAPVLRSPEAWHRTFCSRSQRERLKRLAKRLLTPSDYRQIVRGVLVGDDVAFGEMALALCANRRFRDKWQYQEDRPIVNDLVDFAIELSPRIEKFVGTEFTLEDLGSYISESEPSHDQRRAIAIFACVLGALDSRFPYMVHEQLVKIDDRFHELLGRSPSPEPGREDETRDETSELADLAAKFERASKTLTKTLRTTAGTPTGENRDRSMQQLANFAELQRRCLDAFREAAESLGFAETLDDDPTVHAFREALGRLDSWRARASDVAARQRCLAQVDPVLRLHGPADADEFRAIRSEALALIRRIDEGPDDWDEVVAAATSFAELFEFIEGKESRTLSQDRWGELRARIEENFGEGLLWAVEMGHVEIADEPDRAEPTVTAASDSPEPAQTHASRAVETKPVTAPEPDAKVETLSEPESAPEVGPEPVPDPEPPSAPPTDRRQAQHKHADTESPPVAAAPATSETQVAPTDAEGVPTEPEGAIAASEPLPPRQPTTPSFDLAQAGWEEAVRAQARGVVGRQHEPNERTAFLTTLLGAGRYREAWWAVQSDEELGPSAGLVLALELAQFMTRDSVTGTAEFRAAIEDAFLHASEGVLDYNQELSHLLLAASMLRPALASPDTVVLPLLRQLELPGGLPKSRTLAALITSAEPLLYSTGGALILRASDDDASARLAGLTETTKHWLLAERHARIIYSAGTNVWSTWVNEGGEISRVFEACLENASDASGRIETLLRDWDSDDDIRVHLDDTDRRLRKRLVRGQQIRFRAEEQIRKKVASARDLASRWQRWLTSQSEQVQQYQVTQSSELRRQLLTLLPKVGQELAARLDDATDDIATASAMQVLARAVDALRELLDGRADETPVLDLAKHLVEPALRCPEIRLTEELTLDPDDVDVLPAVARSLESDVSWREHFERQCAERNFRSARLAAELADAEGPADIPAVDRLEEHIEDVRSGLESDVADLRGTLDTLLYSGVLSFDQSQSLTQRLENAVDTDVDELYMALREVDVVRREAFEFRDSAVEAERRRYAELKENNPEHDYARIDSLVQSALEAGEVRLAEEYTVLLEDDVPPSSIGTVEEEAAEWRVLQFLSAADEHYKGRTPFVKRLERQLNGTLDAPAFLDIGNMSAARKKSVLTEVEAWRQLRDTAPSGRRGFLEKCLRTLGIDCERISVDKSLQHHHDYEWYDVHAAPIADRSICQIPKFGSLAKGHYKLLLVRDQVVGEDLLRRVERASLKAASIVVYLNPMSLDERRKLANKSRRQQVPMLVLDDGLALWTFLAPSASEQERRFFRDACRFTFAEPFTDTAGTVPPEMFFGRRKEIQALVSGVTSLLYGGRQLGKTALLRRVEREHHDPAQGSIVIWTDLLYDWQIGTAYPPEKIWEAIGELLFREGVLPKQTSARTRIVEGIVEWLDADPSRRILLLLDEADEFLAQDAANTLEDGTSNEWEQTRQLKSIDLRTDGRFKFVFAGLHNVARSARDVNSPMGHLGSPICVGPMFHGPDMQDAFEMVTRPLSHLGYRFESDGLVHQILAYTNYYPNLIQLFCQTLVRHLSAVSFPAGATPPYTITASIIDDAVQSRELHRQIYSKFDLTLKLDPRYRLIALMLAYFFVADDQRFSGERMRIGEIRRSAIEMAPTLFEPDTSLESFHALLDEMVDLGVLRSTEDGRYLLRSHNVVAMMGDADRLLESLQNAMEAEPKVSYQSGTSRRHDPSHPDRRSPLTAAQESELLAADVRHSWVTIVYGTRASGLDDIGRAIEWAIPKHEPVNHKWLEVNDETDDNAFVDLVAKELDSGDERFSLLLVPQAANWELSWVSAAADRMVRRARQRAKHRCNVVFLGSPARTWRLVAAQGAADLETAGVVRSVSLRPWSDAAVRQWLASVSFDDTRANRDQIKDVTGNWYVLLRRLHERQSMRFDEAISDLAESLGDPALLDAFDLNETARDVLRRVAELGGPITPEDLEELMPAAGIGGPDFNWRLVIDWADRLTFVAPHTEGQWALDPLLARLLLQHAEATGSGG